MARFGKWRISQFLVVAFLVVGCTQERDGRLNGSWAGSNGPNGLTFRADGTAILFEVRKPPTSDYGAPLRWHTSDRKALTIRTIDEEGNISGPRSIPYRIEKDELILSEGYPFGIPDRLTRQR